MASITVHVGARERLKARISKATPLGALGTEALVYLGATASAAAPPRCGRWLMLWSRRPTWRMSTTPTPTPSTSVSRPSVAPTADP
jgi:hypothetical protein